MNKEYWLIDKTKKYKEKMIECCVETSIKEAEKRFERASLIKKNKSYVICESKRWIN